MGRGDKTRHACKKEKKKNALNSNLSLETFGRKGYRATLSY